MLLKQTDNPENLYLIKSLNLQNFYLIEITDTSNITFDILTKKHVIMHG